MQQQKGKHKEALEMYKKALDITIKVHGSEHQNVAMLNGNMGLVYASISELPKALAMSVTGGCGRALPRALAMPHSTCQVLVEAPLAVEIHLRCTPLSLPGSRWSGQSTGMRFLSAFLHCEGLCMLPLKVEHNSNAALGANCRSSASVHQYITFR